MNSYILVVDGGRTHLRAVLLTDEGEVVMRHEEAGLSSVIGLWDVLAKRLNDLVDQTASEAGVDPTRVKRCVAGLAGLGREDDCRELEGLLGAMPFGRHWTVESDAGMTLRAAATHGTVAIAILGTGSVFFARDAGGHVHRVGGWGALLDDYGSGFEIGRRGIQAVFRAWDGTGPATNLTTIFCGRFACADPPGLLAHLYRDKLESSLWASLAPDVVHFAAEGDEVAIEILHLQYEGVSKALRTLYEKSGLNTAVPLFLTGGMVQGIPTFQEGLTEVIRQKLPGLPVSLLEREPFWGGWELARSS